jgi:hypothetical protein
LWGWVTIRSPSPALISCRTGLPFNETPLINDRLNHRPNQRARRLEPKCSFSDRNATDGSW